MIAEAVFMSFEKRDILWAVETVKVHEHDPTDREARYGAKQPHDLAEVFISHSSLY